MGPTVILRSNPGPAVNGLLLLFIKTQEFQA